MRAVALAVAVPLLLAGCSGGAPPGEPDPVPPPADPTLWHAEPGRQMAVRSQTLEGDVAVEVSFLGDEGTCSVEMRASRTSDDTGPGVMRYQGPNSWTYSSGGLPSVSALGQAGPAPPAGASDFGILPRQVDVPGTVWYWAADVAPTANPRTYGASIHVGFVCDQPTDVRIRAAREAFLVSSDAFAATAGATMPLAGAAMVGGWYSVHASVPLAWLYLQPRTGSWNLTAWSVDRPLPVQAPGELAELPAGDVRFELTGAGGDTFVMAGAAFRPVAPGQDLAELPA